MTAGADVLLSTLHYTLQARPNHSNLVSEFLNVPCLTKLLVDAGDGTYRPSSFYKMIDRGS